LGLSKCHSCLIPNNKEHNEKLTELFGKAFDFIDEYPTWNSITRLANYILKKNNTIDCEEVIRLLDDENTSLQAPGCRLTHCNPAV